MQIPILHCKICPWSMLVVPENLTRKFNESREYTFKLDGDVSKGSIHVIVENKNKELPWAAMYLTVCGCFSFVKTE